jgi:hypothetical protein
MALRPSIAALIACAALAGGCETLLPKSRAEVQSPWRSFEEARAAIESIEPGVSRTSDLRTLGIDPYTSPNVQILTFSDIALRFPLSINISHTDKGLRDCLEAGKGCTGYHLNVREVRRDRVGGFWADTLRFKRVVEVTGWSFNALLLIVDDRVVYSLYGGQPKMHEQEVSRHPLGPAQDIGDSLPVGSLLR